MIPNSFLTLFYNSKTLQDVLIAQISNPDKLPVTRTQEKDDCVIFYGENDKLLGFNVTNASSKELNLRNGLNQPTQQLLTKLSTITGLDLSAYVDLIPFIVGQVKNLNKIPNSHLNYCEVDLGQEHNFKIVCGGINVRADLKVVVVVPGGIIANGLEIFHSKVLGSESSGMICSATELGIKQTTAEKTILELPESAIVGSSFTEPYTQK